MNEEEQKKLQASLEIYKDAYEHYSKLASELVKKVLFLEKRYDRRFLYPEEYK